WSWTTDRAHTGRHSLRMNGTASASRSVLKNAIPAPPGGGDLRWSSTPIQSIPYPHPSRFARTVKASLWYRGEKLGGANKLSLTFGSCNQTRTATADKPVHEWTRLDVVLSREEILAALDKPNASKAGQIDISLSIQTTGDPEVYVDDVSLEEDLS